MGNLIGLIVQLGIELAPMVSDIYKTFEQRGDPPPTKEQVKEILKQNLLKFIAEGDDWLAQHPDTAAKPHP